MHAWLPLCLTALFRFELPTPAHVPRPLSVSRTDISDQTTERTSTLESRPFGLVARLSVMYRTYTFACVELYLGVVDRI